MTKDFFKNEVLEKIPVHETYKIAGLLALVGGFLDAYTYMLRGHVFANAQTGNMVLVAVGLVQGNIREALMPVVPILAFMAGVFVTEVIKMHCRKKEFVMWEHLVILLEILLLFPVSSFFDKLLVEFVRERRIKKDKVKWSFASF